MAWVWAFFGERKPGLIVCNQVIRADREEWRGVRMDRERRKQPETQLTRIEFRAEIPVQAKQRIVWFVIETVGIISLFAWALHEIAKNF